MENTSTKFAGDLQRGESFLLRGRVVKVVWIKVLKGSAIRVHYKDGTAGGDKRFITSEVVEAVN